MNWRGEEVIDEKGKRERRLDEIFAAFMAHNDTNLALRYSWEDMKIDLIILSTSVSPSLGMRFSISPLSSVITEKLKVVE